MKIILNMTDPGEPGTISNMELSEAPCDGWQVGGLSACPDHGIGVIFVVRPGATAESKEEMKRCITQAMKEVHKNVLRIIDQSPVMHEAPYGKDNTLH